MLDVRVAGVSVMRMCRGHVRGVFMRVHWCSQLHEQDGKDEQVEHYAHLSVRSLSGCRGDSSDVEEVHAMSIVMTCRFAAGL